MYPKCIVQNLTFFTYRTRNGCKEEDICELPQSHRQGFDYGAIQALGFVAIFTLFKEFVLGTIVNATDVGTDIFTGYNHLR